MATLAPGAVPRLNGIDPRQLAATVAKRGGFRITVSGLTHEVEIPRNAAPLIGALGGGRSFGTLARAAKLDWFAFTQVFGPAWRALTGVNLLRCSQGLSR
jgi:hypothetical protein